jgi:DNA transformation protein
MFGGHALSIDGLTLALVADLGEGEKLWLKTSDATRSQWETAGCERFTYLVTKNGAQMRHSLNYYSAPEDAMDSPDAMRPWARLAWDAALAANALKASRSAKRKPASGVRHKSK